MTVIDLLEVADAFDAAAVQQIRAEMAAARADPATLLGSGPESARKTARVAVSETAQATVVSLLEVLRPRVATHFGRAVDRIEEPQFLRYGPGDYFVAHQDGNTPLLHDESRFRTVSIVIFLSAPGTFGGGSLVLHAVPPLRLAPEPGTLVAFPSETTHEVLPVTHGERLSVVSWYRG